MKATFGSAIIACLVALAANGLEFERVAVDSGGPKDPWIKLTGDIDGDGFPDIVIGGRKGPVAWYAWPDWNKTVIAENGYSTVDGAVGDVDGDGDMDVVIGAEYWYENPMPGGDPKKDEWKTRRISGLRTHDISAADMDGDGDLDLVARDQSGFGHNSGNRIHLFRQDGPEQWTRFEIECPHGEGLLLGDLDMDGDLDILAGPLWYENTGEVWRADWPGHAIVSDWHPDTSIAMADFNADGRPDLALSRSEGPWRLSWFEAPDDPRQSGWMEHEISPSFDYAHGLAAADFDLDGLPDLAAAEMHQSGRDRVAVFLNGGNGAEWKSVLLTDTGSHNIQAADFGSDGDWDLMGANWSGGFQPIEAWINPARSGPAMGPLRAHSDNPRYFSNGREAVFLTGSHVWYNLADMGPTDPPEPFDFAEYLNWMEGLNHNFIRLWAWETTIWNTNRNNPNNLNQNRVFYVRPHPWKRTGPGEALDGKPKFDLTEWDDEYFARLRDRVAAARDKGIYVSVMLFEGWGVQFAPDAWKYHPFNGENNVNGVDGDINNDGKGLEIHTLANPELLEIQQEYAKKVIQTVNGFDNVLYEISNENHPPSTLWQYRMIEFIHECERAMPFQHPVGMTFQYRGGSNETLFRSPAEWISPNHKGGYRDNPPAANGSKVVITDTDHLWGIGGNHAWVWKSVCRGLNPIFMDPYDAVVLGDEPFDGEFEPLRRAMGVARAAVDGLDLDSAVPVNDAASTGYCLAVPGEACLIYLPEGKEVAVDLTRIGDAGFEAVWIDPVTGERTSGGSSGGDIDSAKRVQLTSPLDRDDSVLLLTAAKP